MAVKIMITDDHSMIREGLSQCYVSNFLPSLSVQL